MDSDHSRRINLAIYCASKNEHARTNANATFVNNQVRMFLTQHPANCHRGGDASAAAIYPEMRCLRAKIEWARLCCGIRADKTRCHLSLLLVISIEKLADALSSGGINFAVNVCR
jgi:hypothetical protein